MKDDGTGDGGHEYAKHILTFKKRSALVRNAMLALPRWVTPNGVTIFRTLLIIPVAYLLRQHAYWLAFLTLSVAMILDFVDGALAAVRGEHTLLGAFLDPLSDKVLICGTLLAILDRVPWPFIPVTVVICAVAVAKTAVRVVEIAKVRRARTENEPKKAEKEPDIGAKPGGKLKLVAEALSLLLTVVGLGAGSATIVWIGCAGLTLALYLALTSFRDQLFSRVKVSS